MTGHCLIPNGTTILPTPKVIATVLWGCLGTAWLVGGILADQSIIVAERVEVSSRAGLLRAVSEAVPGTTIAIKPGTYAGGLSFRELHGTAESPITIRAAAPARPPVFRGGAYAIHLVAPRHVRLRHLVSIGATQNGLNIDDGGRRQQPAVGVVVDHVRVADVGPQGNRDGLKMSGVDDFRVQDCSFARWGDSGSAIDLVGCHDGVIERCRFEHRSGIAANGIQTKGGSASITIRKNLLIDAGSRALNLGGSTGRAYFRPPAANYEARDITVIDNRIVGSDAAIAFVGVDGAEVRQNTIIEPKRWVLRILQETRDPDFIPCRNGRFRRNLIVYQEDELRSVVNVSSGTEVQSFRFAENYWHARGSDLPGRLPRLPQPEIDGVAGPNPEFLDPEQDDFSLPNDSPAQDYGARS